MRAASPLLLRPSVRLRTAAAHYDTWSRAMKHLPERTLAARYPNLSNFTQSRKQVFNVVITDNSIQIGPRYLARIQMIYAKHGSLGQGANNENAHHCNTG